MPLRARAKMPRAANRWSVRSLRDGPGEAPSCLGSTCCHPMWALWPWMLAWRTPMLERMGEWGSYDGGLGLAQLADGARRLDDAEAMRLLASVGYGRVVFTLNALPAIRPVNHLLDDGRIIIRTRLTASISAAVRSKD